MPHSAFTSLGQAEGEALLALARESIRHGIEYGRPHTPELQNLPQALQSNGCCFVTLEKQGQLRGCIGSLTAYQPLGLDVTEHAFQAAFRDPRFPPLQREEVAELSVHLSVIGPPERILCNSETELLSQLRPGTDGLILEASSVQRATFLPSVWAHLRDPADFLVHLRRKAGLPGQAWSPDWQWFRYQTWNWPPD